MEGMGMFSRQRVFLQRLQLKCTWASPGRHIHSSSQMEYFMEPVPSSIPWINKCSWNRLRVRKMVDLLTVSSSASRSVRLKALSKPHIDFRINSLRAVGLISLFINFSSSTSIANTLVHTNLRFKTQENCQNRCSPILVRSLGQSPFKPISGFKKWWAETTAHQ